MAAQLLHVVVAAVLPIQAPAGVRRGVGRGLQLLASWVARMLHQRPGLTWLVTNIGIGLVHHGIIVGEGETDIYNTSTHTISV